MTNAEWMIKNGYKFGDLLFSFDSNGDTVISLNDKILARGQYIPSVKRWLDKEYEEQILNDAEKKYLSAVIKPFRDHVRYICKGVCKSYSLKKEFQFIKISTGKGVYDSIIMPGFAPDTIYQGMELSKHYTPEELGL